MKLSNTTLKTLAEMICGPSGNNGYSWGNFPYRSSSSLSQFFSQCGLNYVHDGSTRLYWVSAVLAEINDLPANNPSLPAEEMMRVLQQLVDPIEYERTQKDYQKALDQINLALSRDGLQLSPRNSGIVVENLKSKTTSTPSHTRLLTHDEEIRYQEFVEFLENASEDEFTEEILVKLFHVLGFQRVRVTGHQDRGLEFGKDLWMKYQLPTGHQLFIGVQVKKDRIHASGSDLTDNIGGILAQLQMLMTYPVFDQETNSKHLVDHIFLVSSGNITKQARTLLSEELDRVMRRNVMFMDRDDILDLCLQYALPLPSKKPEDPSNEFTDENVGTSKD